MDSEAIRKHQAECDDERCTPCGFYELAYHELETWDGTHDGKCECRPCRTANRIINNAIGAVDRERDKGWQGIG